MHQFPNALLEIGAGGGKVSGRVGARVLALLTTAARCFGRQLCPGSRMSCGSWAVADESHLTITGSPRSSSSAR